MLLFAVSVYHAGHILVIVRTRRALQVGNPSCSSGPKRQRQEVKIIFRRRVILTLLERLFPSPIRNLFHLQDPLSHLAPSR